MTIATQTTPVPDERDAAPEDKRKVRTLVRDGDDLREFEFLEDGADFAEVATRESEDGAAKSGGKLGTFDKGEMREDLEEAVADLDPGEFSKPVRGSTGIHIVRLDARAGDGDTAATDGDKPVPDAKAEEIKEQLYAKALEERYNRWLREDLRARHHVEIRP